MDLGDCPKIHDLALRADYEQACDGKDYYYDIDAMEHLQAFINDCDRRTELAKRRLAETQEELSAEVAAKANKVHDLAEQIEKKLARAEQLGADGNVEESLKLMEEVEEIRKKKLQAEQEYRNSMPASSYQQQKLRVCEVCSAYLGIHDNDRRLADHFGGKLHLGFIKIREKLDELNKCVSDRREKMKGDRECRSGNGGSSRDRSETRPRKREHDRDEGRDRGRDRDRKERSSDTKKSRSRSRSRGRRSGRRPDSRKRSRSRDRKRSHDDSKSDKSDRRRERSRSKSKDGGRRASGDRSPKRSIKVEESGRSSVEGLGERRSTDGDSHRNGGSSE